MLVRLADGTALLIQQRGSHEHCDHEHRAQSRGRTRTRPNRNVYALQVDRDCRAIEKAWIPRIQEFFVNFGAETARKMQGRSRRISKLLREKRAVIEDDTLLAQEIIDEVWDATAFTEAFITLTSGMLDDAATVALERLALTLGLTFDIGPSFAVQQALAQRANQLAGYVSESTYRQLKRNLRRGILEGEPIPDLAKRVQQSFRAASKTRATVIARTEVISAYNGAVYHGAMDLPGNIVGGMEWIATSDGRTRPSHREADGQIVAAGELFQVGGENLRYPGDPAGSARNIIQCRCTTAVVTADEIGGRQPAMIATSDVERLLLEVALGHVDYRHALVELCHSGTVNGNRSAKAGGL